MWFTCVKWTFPHIITLFIKIDFLNHHFYVYRLSQSMRDLVTWLKSIFFRPVPIPFFNTLRVSGEEAKAKKNVVKYAVVAILTEFLKIFFLRPDRLNRLWLHFCFGFFLFFQDRSVYLYTWLQQLIFTTACIMMSWRNKIKMCGAYALYNQKNFAIVYIWYVSKFTFILRFQVSFVLFSFQPNWLK